VRGEVLVVPDVLQRRSAFWGAVVCGDVPPAAARVAGATHCARRDGGRRERGCAQQEQAASAAYKIAQFLAQITPPIRATNQTLRISVSGMPG
jgi:hypothetical protein